MRSVKKYLITLGIGFALVLWIGSAKGVFHQTHPVAVFRILCDAFFVAGAVITGAGLLVFISNEGTFDMFVYGTRSLADRFRKNGVKRYKSYYDYQAARAEKKFPFAFLLICGAFFLAVAMVMLYLYQHAGA